MEIDLLNTHIQLENDRVLLLPFEHPRNGELKKIIFNDDIWTYMGAYVRTERDFANYSDSALKDKKNGICLPFIIIDKRNNKVAGSTRYGYLNPLSEKCEIGWTWYGLDFQGTGLNKACKYELLKFGFENIGFRRIQFSADSENIRSQRAIEKLGAQKEGVFRNNYIDSRGESRHDVYYSIINAEWDSMKATYFKEFI
ncbi:GNAT family N-acetyltransferase [Ascidiimonas sp. W6]|uniref:GNAT family N-acetyltransferase n=1 Tax=Ascidiimonas meishanensis TaxID=3128903 RepID=UPI0030EBB2D6